MTVRAMDRDGLGWYQKALYMGMCVSFCVHLLSVFVQNRISGVVCVCMFECIFTVLFVKLGITVN